MTDTLFCPHCGEKIDMDLTVKHGPLTFDGGTVWRGGNSVALQPVRYRIVEALARRFGCWYTNIELFDFVYSENETPPRQKTISAHYSCINAACVPIGIQIEIIRGQARLTLGAHKKHTFKVWTMKDTAQLLYSRENEGKSFVEIGRDMGRASDYLSAKYKKLKRTNK